MEGWDGNASYWVATTSETSPCHGSRYTYDGQVIQGPAVDHLELKHVHET